MGPWGRALGNFQKQPSSRETQSPVANPKLDPGLDLPRKWVHSHQRNRPMGFWEWD